MFKKLVKRIAEATSYEELMDILYGEDGVDRLFQKEKISWKDHELLFQLVAVHKYGEAC